MPDFVKRVALVTGGTRGIGRACAAELARAGHDVAICGRNAEMSAEAAGALAKEAGVDGSAVRGYGCDTADAGAVAGLFEAVQKDLGPVGILVNNAGITRDGLLMRMKDEDWSAVIRTNLDGAFLCSRAAMRPMFKARWGRIINISSIIGVRGQAGQCNYAASKAGLIGFSKSLAQEAASRGVTVNVVAPGYIETDMTAVLPEDKRAAIVDHVPLGRVGSVDDVAAAVAFLAGERAAYITGAVLQVDGGLAM